MGLVNKDVEICMSVKRQPLCQEEYRSQSESVAIYLVHQVVSRPNHVRPLHTFQKTYHQLQLSGNNYSANHALHFYNL